MKNKKHKKIKKPGLSNVDKHKLRIAALDAKGVGKVGQKTIDITPYAGQYVRVWLDADGNYSLDKHKDHAWQIAEFQVPKQQYTEVDTGEKDEKGNPVVRLEPIPIDLDDVDIKVWELPDE